MARIGKYIFLFVVSTFILIYALITLGIFEIKNKPWLGREDSAYAIFVDMMEKSGLKIFTSEEGNFETIDGIFYIGLPDQKRIEQILNDYEESRSLTIIIFPDFNIQQYSTYYVKEWDHLLIYKAADDLNPKRFLDRDSDKGIGLFYLGEYRYSQIYTFLGINLVQNSSLRKYQIFEDVYNNLYSNVDGDRWMLYFEDDKYTPSNNTTVVQPLKIFFSQGVLQYTLIIVFIILLVMFRASIRFGPPQINLQLEKRMLKTHLENTALFWNRYKGSFVFDEIDRDRFWYELESLYPKLSQMHLSQKIDWFYKQFPENRNYIYLLNDPVSINQKKYIKRLRLREDMLFKILNGENHE